MIPGVILNHEAESLELLTDQFKGRHVIEGLVKSFAARAQLLEDVIWAVINGRKLADCAGVWLDAYGAIVGEKRNGRSDDAYRAAVRLRIRVNRSQGRSVDVLDVATLADSSATYTEMGQASWRVDIAGNAEAGEISILLAQAKAAGTYGVLGSSTFPDAEVQRFGRPWGLRWGAALPTNPRYRRGG